MKKLVSLARDLNKDESGASFIEYTVLLGVILAASIAVIAAVGTWASGVWVSLNGQVNP
jgi:Flp pilus assembly pilin Flp